MRGIDLRRFRNDARGFRFRFSTWYAARTLLVAGIVLSLPCRLPAASASASQSDSRSRAHLFGDGLTPDALEVCRRARAMPDQPRYEYLLANVLPADSDRIRLTLDYLPANPAPPIVKKYGTGEPPLILPSSGLRSGSGGVLVSPAVELVATAQRVGELQELREIVQQRSPPRGEQLKAQLALEILISWMSNDEDRAGGSLDELVKLIRDSPITDPDRTPESVVLWTGLRSPQTQVQVADLLYLLYQQSHGPGTDHRERFKRHVSSFKFLLDQTLDAKMAADSTLQGESLLSNWSAVSCRTAESQGEGFPRASWSVPAGSVRKITCHGDDYLYFASPLQGDFEVEADLTTYDLREIRLAAGGYWAGSRPTLNECEHGLFRHQLPLLPLEEPLTNIGSTLRARIVVREGVRRTFINGRCVYERPHAAQADPWIAIYCPWNTSGTAANLRITGSPEIPDEINLLSNPDLPGWVSYYDESVGGAEADWRMAQTTADSPPELIGRSRTELRGANLESLLRYHRPMLEDGTIEYEFYFQEGEAAVSPALDRCCFVFDAQQAGLHWLSDGRYDRTGLDPANLTPIETLVSAADPLPLIANDWNRVALTLRGDSVEIALNEVPILRRSLEPENLRTFGLFHYCDQTRARVRNLRWRGDWPRELPTPRQQELADNALQDELAVGPELPLVFEHDFADGLPADKIWGGGREGWHFHAEELPDGVRIANPGGWYAQQTLSVPLQVKGDFDIAAEYADLQSQVAPGGEGDIQLELIFADSVESDFRLYRKHHHRKNGSHEQIVEVGFFQQLEKHTHRSWHGQLAEEGTAGTLRIVRRGDQLFLLHASGDSQNDRLVHRQQVTTAPVRFGGVKLVTESHSDTVTEVVWKRVSVRAESPTGLDERSAVTVEQLDDQRASLSQGRHHDFNQQTPLDQFQTWGNPVHILKQRDGWLVNQPGTEEWVWCGFHCLWGLRGDYDLTLALDVVKLEETAGNHETYFLMKNRVTSSFLNDAEFKISSTGRGQRELVIQQNMSHQNGERRYEKIRIHPIKSVTHLRLARRGDVLYFLYRPEGQTSDELLGHLLVSTDDIPAGTLMTMCRTGGVGKQTILKLKSMDLRAAGIFP